MNSGFTGIRLVPYLRAQYESQKESNGLILQATEARRMRAGGPRGERLRNRKAARENAKLEWNDGECRQELA